MKKIFLTFLIFLSLGYAKDLDILSIASNGSLSDKTSHKLNDDELKQVVGGLYAIPSNIIKNGDWGIYDSGDYHFATDWYVVLSETEKLNKAIYFTGQENYYQANLNYRHFLLISKTQTPVLRIRYNSLDNSITYFFAGLDSKGMYWQMADSFAQNVKQGFYNSGIIQKTMSDFDRIRLELKQQGVMIK